MCNVYMKNIIMQFVAFYADMSVTYHICVISIVHHNVNQSFKIDINQYINIYLAVRLMDMNIYLDSMRIIYKHINIYPSIHPS